MLPGPGLLFAGMAVVSLVGVMPAAWVADHLGRKWTIVPSCLGLAASLLLMAATRAHPTCVAVTRAALACLVSLRPNVPGMANNQTSSACSSTRRAAHGHHAALQGGQTSSLQLW